MQRVSVRMAVSAAAVVCASLLVSPLFRLYAYSESDLLQAVRDNERETRLAEYRDNETTLKLKLEVLDVINANRARHRLAPVRLDILACRVASRTSSEAVKGGYFGHWNLRGEKPYHRWAFAGGLDHVSENAAMRWSSLPMTRNYGEVLTFITQAHMAMYNETPPNDGHRQNILNPWHTHVGLGFSLVETDFRYYELFVDRYLELDPVPASAKAGGEVRVSGLVAAPGYGAYFAIVFYEPFPVPMSPSEIKAMGSYPDFTDRVEAKFPPWEIDYDGDTRRFSFAFKPPRPGLYYVHVYVKKGHTGKERPGYVTTQGLNPVSGIVVRVE